MLHQGTKVREKERKEKRGRESPVLTSVESSKNCFASAVHPSNFPLPCTFWVAALVHAAASLPGLGRPWRARCPRLRRSRALLSERGRVAVSPPSGVRRPDRDARCAVVPRRQARARRLQRGTPRARSRDGRPRAARGLSWRMAQKMSFFQTVQSK